MAYLYDISTKEGMLGMFTSKKEAIAYGKKKNKDFIMYVYEKRKGIITYIESYSYEKLKNGKKIVWAVTYRR